MLLTNATEHAQQWAGDAFFGSIVFPIDSIPLVRPLLGIDKLVAFMGDTESMPQHVLFMCCDVLKAYPLVVSNDCSHLCLESPASLSHRLPPFFWRDGWNWCVVPRQHAIFQLEFASLMPGSTFARTNQHIAR